jgi:hypothetical protein
MQRNDPRVNMLIDDLRRSLYLSKILAYNTEGLAMSVPALYSGLRTDAKNLLNCVNRIEKFIIQKLPSEHFIDVRDELNHDRLHDINLLLDEIMNIANIDDITQVIKESKMIVNE